MNKKNGFYGPLIALTQSLLLVLYLCYPSVSLADSAKNLDYADLTKLASLETVIYGSSHTNFPNTKRVESLEKIIFGKTHNGSLHSRIFAIATTISGKTTNELSPPIAPELDRTDISKDSVPPIAPTTNGQIENSNIESASDAQNNRIKDLLKEAMQLYGQGQVSQAQAIFKKVLSIDNQNADANFNLGAIAEKNADWQTALQYYKKALKANPTDEETQRAVNSMQAQIASSKTNNSPTNSNNNKKLSAKQIETLKSQVNQAASDYEKGNYDAAISTLKAVIAQAPDQADVYYALGQAYKAKHDYKQASLAFNQASNRAPGNKQYQDALTEVSNLNSQRDNTLASNGSDIYSSSSNNSNNGWENDPKESSLAPPGQITPFSDSTNNELGWQPVNSGTSNNQGSYYANGMTGGYTPSFYSNYIPRSMTYRIERVAIGSLAGAALGSMIGGRGYRGRGAFTGAMVGGMLGLMSGNRRW